MNGECGDAGPSKRCALPDTSTALCRRIISNERFMRACLSLSESEISQTVGDVDRVSKPPTEPTWKSWLVRLGSPHAHRLFGQPDAKVASHTIERPEQMSGLCLLDKGRRVSLQIRTRNAFREQWHHMTQGILHGLDWSNVFVAGGMVMGVLTASFNDLQKSSYSGSDIE